LQYEREQICEEGTNKLCWKKTKGYLNEQLYQRIQAYSPIGQKTGSYTRYQVIDFVERNIDGIEMNEMEKYSWYLSKILKWMLTMIEHRKDDVKKRRDIK
jgi:hypothetical protein